MTKDSTAILNRYTTVPFALDLLVQKRITLLNPEFWDDQNDAYYLRRYKEENRLRALFALCFTTHPETFHHWKIYSDGPSGVCIEFGKESLIAQLKRHAGVRIDGVTYKWVKDVQNSMPEIRLWPFLKRMPFKDERELRVIYESTENIPEQSKSFPLDLSAVRKITLSPWLPKDVADTIVKLVCNIKDCGKIKVHRSQLLEHAAWRDAILRRS